MDTTDPPHALVSLLRSNRRLKPQIFHGFLAPFEGFPDASLVPTPKWLSTFEGGRLILTVLGGLAEFEGELIRQRTGEGRARAKARGQSLGRPFKLTPHQHREAKVRHDAGGTLVDIGRSMGVSHMTIARAVELEAG